eukprot:TRINITY_DN1214_c0_g1_i1.p1 TRINITY_DN1214_c0_g1~~TRINITY_DN1214_c0_g1_i1.p1  ORF type:complete len:325 (-),score=72.21 TRINITY_DN1214_c0_g1_i1:755-1729(-)
MKYFIILLLCFALSHQQNSCGTSDDFSVLYNGIPAFTVSHANRTCWCSQFQSESLLISDSATIANVHGATGDFNALTVGSLSVLGPSKLGSASAATLNVTGPSKMDSAAVATLNVTGATTLSTTSVSGALTAGTATMGATTMSSANVVGNLGVTGTTTLGALTAGSTSLTALSAASAVFTSASVSGTLTAGTVSIGSDYSFGPFYAANDIRWALTHAAAQGACAATALAGASCCGQRAYALVSTSTTTCTAFCATMTGYTRCSGAVAVNLFTMKKVTLADAANPVGAHYNYGCSGSIDNSATFRQDLQNAGNPGLYSVYCCCMT